MTPSAQRKDLFLRARDIESSAEREAFLAQACNGDAELLAHVNALLQVDQRALPRFMEKPHADTAVQSLLHAQLATTPMAELESPGSVIGPYTILHKLGEGGMGAVFAAQQTVPIKRSVAIKIIRHGMNGTTATARFETELQALALMDHPFIAKVYDAGTTRSGAPYFVMELIDGVPIVAFCDNERVNLADRLTMFASLCDAIQHAHQKGIIHRDIKPNNVLVTLANGKPIPKVIDFGVAKAMNPILSENALETQAGTILGTLDYMSPEQTDSNPTRVDTRSDVYSLGVLLYELLTGTTPLRSECGRKMELFELIRALREDDPPKPSTRILDLNAASRASVAEKRGMEPARLARRISGELDWIATKALEKDPARRYGSPHDLARDIERHLNDEPLEAGPPSGWYRVSKILRRNKWPFMTAAALILALLIGVGAIVYQFNRDREALKIAVASEHEQARLRSVAEVARAHADDERIKAESARANAEASEKKSMIEAGKSREFAKFMQEILDGIKPEIAVQRDTTLFHDILEDTARRLDTQLKNQPEVQAQLSRSLAEAYAAIGDTTRGEAMRRKAVELLRTLPDRPAFEYSRALCELGNVVQQRDPQAALDILKEALNESHGSADADIVHITALWSTGYLLHSLNRLDESERMYRDALALVPATDLTRRARSLASLARVVSDQKKKPEADAVLKEVRALLKQLEASPQEARIVTLYPMLAAALRDCDENREAIDLLTNVQDQLRRFGGNEGVILSDVTLLLGQFELDSDDLSLGQAKLSESLDIYSKRFGERNTKTLARAREIALTLLSKSDKLLKAERGADAERLARDSLAINEKYFSGQYEAAIVRGFVGRCLWNQRKFADAEELLSASANSLIALNKKNTRLELQRVRKAVRDLIQFYSETNQPEKRAYWVRQGEALDKTKN